MTRNPEEPDELRALFERSAAEVDAPALGRLRAAARALPARARGRFALPSWAWAMGLAALTALPAVFLLSRPGPTTAGPRAAAPATASPPRAPGTAALGSASRPVESAEGVAAEGLASSQDSDDLGEPSSFDDLALDLGDLSEAEVDAWISAASAVLDG